VRFLLLLLQLGALGFGLLQERDVWVSVLPERENSHKTPAPHAALAPLRPVPLVRNVGRVRDGMRTLAEVSYGHRAQGVSYVHGRHRHPARVEQRIEFRGRRPTNLRRVLEGRRSLGESPLRLACWRRGGEKTQPHDVALSRRHNTIERLGALKRQFEGTIKYVAQFRP
jgi:hypothetical protein